MSIQRFVVSLFALAAVVVGAGSSVASGQLPGPAPAAQSRPVPSTVPATPGQDVTLVLGQEAAVAGKDLAVRYTKLVADSRCRPDMTCFWQGEASLAFLLSKPGRGQSTTAELHSGPRTGPQATTFAGHRVELLTVSQDGREATVRVG